MPSTAWSPRATRSTARRSRRLYSGELKASATLYWKDVVEAMEDALDALEDASDVIEGIVLKHA